MSNRVSRQLALGQSTPIYVAEVAGNVAPRAQCIGDPTCTQLSRDEFITYDDIYNIAYAIGNRKTRKDMTSWKDDLKSQGYFTYYDEDKDQFYGFSSPCCLHSQLKPEHSLSKKRTFQRSRA
jgi:ferredoxin